MKLKIIREHEQEIDAKKAIVLEFNQALEIINTAEYDPSEAYPYAIKEFQSIINFEQNSNYTEIMLTKEQIIKLAKFAGIKLAKEQ